MRLTAFVLAMIAGPAAADDLSASIEVGRFGVMLDQAAAIEQVALPAASTGDDLYGQLVATVGRADRLDPVALMRREIRRRQKPAARLHRGCDRRADLALIEDVAPFVADPFER